MLQTRFESIDWKKEARSICETMATTVTKEGIVKERLLHEIVGKSTTMADPLKRAGTDPDGSNINPRMNHTDAQTLNSMRIGHKFDPNCKECMQAVAIMKRPETQTKLLSGDRDDMLRLDGIKEHVDSKLHRNREGFAVNGECQVCGQLDHRRRDCPDLEITERENYCFPKTGPIPTKPRCEELCAEDDSHLFRNYYEERRVKREAAALVLTDKMTAMFKRWAENQLRISLININDDLPSLLKGEVSHLNTQVHEMTVACLANVATPSEHPELRYAANPVECTGCKSVHCKLDDGLLYAEGSTHCMNLTLGCLHRLPNKRQVENAERHKVGKTLLLECEHCIYSRTKDEGTDSHGELKPTFAARVKNAEREVANEQERLRFEVRQRGHVLRKLAEATIRDHVKKVMRDDWEARSTTDKELCTRVYTKLWEVRTVRVKISSKDADNRDMIEYGEWTVAVHHTSKSSVKAASTKWDTSIDTSKSATSAGQGSDEEGIGNDEF